jgi:hypothetical protein
MSLTPLLDYLNNLVAQLQALANPTPMQTQFLTVMNNAVQQGDDNKAVAYIFIQRLEAVTASILATQ